MPKILIEVGGSSSNFCENCPNLDDRYCTIFYIGIDDDGNDNLLRCEDCLDLEFHEVNEDGD